uniref:EamA domain-containing protein n=1 Tax=Amphora coffeiformis TaxID=265554 RepID=A0A7S3L915_9STRA
MPFSDTFQNLPVCSADENQPLLWDQRQGSSSDLAIGYGYPVTEDIDDNVVDHVPDQEEAVIWTDMTLLEAVSESAEEWQHAVADIAEERRDASNDMTYPTLTPFAAYTASSLSPSSSVLSVTALPVGTVDNEDDTDDINTEKADDEDYEVQIKKIVDKDDETAAVASPPLSAYLLLAAAVVGLSSIGPFLNLQSDVDPMIKIVWRNISTAVALFPLALWETFKQPPRLTWPQIMLLLLTGAAYAGLTVCFSWSLAYTSVGNTTLLGNSQALVFLIGKVVMGQPIGRLEGAGALVAFGGLYLCSSSTAGTGNDDDDDDDDDDDTRTGLSSLLGDGLAIIASTSGAFYLVAAKSVRPLFGLYTFMFAVMLLAGLDAFCVAYLSGRDMTLDRDAQHGIFGWTRLQSDRLPMEMLMILVCQFVGSIGYIRSMNHFSNLVIAVAVLCEPVAAEAIEVLLGVGSFPGMAGLFGNVLVIIGTIGVVYRPKNG